MNYYLHPTAEASPGRTVLTRSVSHRPWITQLFRVLALLAWVGGLLFYGKATTFYPTALTLWLFGIGCLAWAMNVLVGRPMRMPGHFVFDNSKGALVMQGEDHEHNPLEACLPYEDIYTFRIQRVDGRAGSGARRHYDVEMHKRDGAFWKLHRANTREAAEATCEALERRIDLLNVPQTAQEALTSAGQIEISEEEAYTRLRWRERGPIRTGLFCFWGNLGFALLAMSLHPYMQELLWQISSGCFGLFALFGASFALLSLERRHTITVSDQEVRYQHPHPTPEQSNFHIKAIDIHTILFNFSLDPGKSRLFVLRRGETNNLLRHKHGQAGVGRPDTMDRLLRNIHQIDAKELSFAEQLHLEYALQQIIRQRCQHNVA